MSTFYLKVKKDHSVLELREKGAVLASKRWSEARDMGRQLFEAIQALLTEKGLKPADIADFEVETDVSDNFTSVKIAQTVQNTFNFAVKAQEKHEKGLQ